MAGSEDDALDPPKDPKIDPFALTSSVNDSILIRDLEEGAVIKLRNGDTAEVTANPRDGGWLFVRIMESEDASKIGNEDMVFCVDVLGAR